MVGELRYQHLGDGRLGGQPALDQAHWRRCLHDHVRASAAGVFGPAHDQHPELRRHDVQALRDVLADGMQRQDLSDGAAQAQGAHHAKGKGLGLARHIESLADRSPRC